MNLNRKNQSRSSMGRACAFVISLALALIAAGSVTSDNYWKGKTGHRNALKMVEVYQCPDPFAMTEMEEIAVARTVERLGMLDRLIILRDSVNMDVFMLSATPENLWGEGKAVMLSSEESGEAANIFVTAMRNNFNVGRIIIDRILAGLPV